MRGYLGGRTLFTKSIALPLSVASGLTLGPLPRYYLTSLLTNATHCRQGGTVRSHRVVWV